jgi:hypothetical protein
LRVLFGKTDAELFGKAEPERPAVEGDAELVSRIDASHSVDRSAIETFPSQAEVFRTLERKRRRRSRRRTPWPDPAEVERAARHRPVSAPEWL